ncbi:MAG: outer membrane protein assembly factor BamD [Verrucomicrobium sp.]|nr:outer membrane protein assembly factor BamD [Verrucomicrobium sp.]
MVSRLLFLLAALSFAAVGTPASAALVWRPGEGWVDETTGSGLSASSSRDQLDIAKKLEAQQKWDDALKAYQIVVRKWPLSFFAPEAQYKIGWCLEQKGKYLDAYKAYDKMVEKYPASTFFEQALDREFAIGNLYLAGEPQRMAGIPMGPSMEKAAEIFQSVIKAAPYGKNAAQAQFKIGLAHEKEKKWTEAVSAYTKILDKYPGNPIAADAQYQIGYAWFCSASAADYDQSAAQKAVEAFEDFIVRFPASEKVAAANTHIQTLKSRQIQGSFNIARFYEKQKNYKAAYIYYSDVVRRNPDSQLAAESQKKIAILRPLIGQNSDEKTPESQVDAPAVPKTPADRGVEPASAPVSGTSDSPLPTP